jgi:hypothetical protein
MSVHRIAKREIPAVNRVVNRHIEKSTIDDEEEARNMTMVSPHLERIDEQSDGKQREGQG